MTDPSKQTCESAWAPGWTLTAPSEHLFRETSTPLHVSLHSTPLTLQIEIHGIRAEVVLSLATPYRLSLSAHGLRVSTDREDGSANFSFVQIDGTTLLMEADETALSFAADGEIVERQHPPAFVVSSAPYHVIMVVDWSIIPNRMAITSGTGDIDLLVQKARTHLAWSAHDHMDQLLRDRKITVGGSGETADIHAEAYEFLKSRLRPACPKIPFPWLAGDRQEPAWDLAMIGLVSLMLRPREPELAQGLLENIIELIDQNGNLPSAHGDVQPLRHDAARFPILLQLFVSNYRQTGRWPVELTQAAPALSRYFEALLDQAPQRASNQEDDQRFRILVRQEWRAWGEILHIGGRQIEQNSRGIREKIRAHNLEERIPFREGAWWLLVDESSARLLKTDDWLQELRALRMRCHDDPAYLNADRWIWMTLIANRLPEVAPNAEAEWRSWLRDEAVRAWRERRNALFGAGSPAPGSLVSLAAAVGLNQGILEGDTTIPGSATVAGASFVQWLNQRRKTLAVGIAALLLLFTSGVLLLQCRRTLPRSVFETRIGMMLHFYAAGDYTTALEKLEELEKRGHADSPILRAIKGRVFFKQRAYDRAIDEFAFVANRHDFDPIPLYNLGVSQFYAGRHQDAVETFGRVIDGFSQTHPVLAARAQRALEIALTFVGKPHE
ncbi:MAG TPA: tetratricopeptide repeat protein [Kiritimatiellia bacterium]|nr:tetratricopeptide repeat protein [Kiritimatiellia bacterium]HMO99252.1 tetratricopeptide repeat protein [Kiritimatiellia bacterium]HMP96956.1 tetratricopeptide repeat protein [Kiritimatiellia bacterium]